MPHGLKGKIMATGCQHKETHYESWPDGGEIEVCNDCGKSRYHMEWGPPSPWTMIEDIGKARVQLQEAIDKMVSSA